MCKIKLITLTLFFKAPEEHFEHSVNEEKILISLFWLDESLDEDKLKDLLSDILRNAQHRLEKKDLESFVKTKFENSKLGNTFECVCVFKYHEEIQTKRLIIIPYRGMFPPFPRFKRFPLNGLLGY